MKRWQYILIIIIGFLGVVIATELTSLHLKILSEPNFESFCNISKSVNCDTVNSSKYSEIFSIPISHLGFLTYLFIIILAIFSLKGHPLANLLNTANFIIFIFCNLYSIVLFYISLAIIKSLCILCCGLYIVNLLLFTVALFNIKSYFTLRVLNPFRKNPGFTITITLFIILSLTSSITLRNIIINHRNQQRITQQKNTEIVYKEIDIADSFTTGPQNAPITIVEVTDFECPFCRKAYPIVKEAIKRYQNKVKFVFKHFPLGTDCNPRIRRNMHPNACLAAYAANCAGKQDNFWDYIDRLMTGKLSREMYIKYADDLGLDREKFISCLDSNMVRQTVARDIETCIRCQIVSVPTIFINGRMLIGAKPLQEYIFVIEEELRRAEGKR